MTLTGLGPAALAVSLGAAGMTAVAAVVRRPRLATWMCVAAFAGLSVAVVGLAVALIGNDGSLVYVADHTSRATSWPYRLAGLWGGMAGSLLLWTWLAAAWAVVAGAVVRRRAPDLAAGVLGVLGAEVAVLSALLVTVTRPFDRLAVPAIDGGGLNPVLLHPAMLYHPPLLYAGAVGLAVPFALAVAGLPSGRDWLPLAARASQVSLVLLSAGLLAGAHWAYVELGWGGYWAWDPVENGGLLPWLAAVAFLHAAAGARRRRASSASAAALAGLAFALGLLGAFLTRSGATESVHAFAEGRVVGQVLGGALVVAAAATAVLVVRARRRSRPRPGVGSPGLIAANNVVLVALVVVIGFGTVFPVVARWVTGDTVVVTGRYFSTVGAPLAVALVVLLGAAPRARRVVPAAAGAVVGVVLAVVVLPQVRPMAVLLLASAGAAVALTVAGWRRERAARWPLAHLGVAVLLAGVAGTTTGAHVTATLAPGQAVTVRGWTLRLEEIVPVAVADGGRAAEARIVLGRHGRTVATLRPDAVLSDTGQRVSVAALRSTPLQDVQVALRAVGEGRAVAVVDVTVLPLVQLVWWGGLLVVAGLALGLRQPSRRAGTTVTGNGSEAVNGSAPEATPSSTYTPPSRRRKVTLTSSGSTSQ